MPPKGKRHSCGHCQDGFSTKSKLQAHLLTHDESQNVVESTSTSSTLAKGLTLSIANKSTVATLPDSVRQNLLNSLPSPITAAILKNQRDAATNKDVKDELESAKFREFKCNKCDRSFTTSGSHKRHQSGCKATTKIIQLNEDGMESDDIEDIESVPSSSDDEITFATSTFQTMKAKMTGNISRRVNSLLKEKKAKMVTCNVCKSKYNKDFGDCKKCKINELKKRMNETPKKTPPKPAKQQPQQPPEVCVACGEIFPNKDTLSIHQMTCDVILKDKEDKEKENLGNEDGYATPEKPNEGNEECATCGDKFNSKVELLEHLATHTGPMEKILMCGICSKTFSRKYHLDRHMMMTSCSGQPPPSHVCQVCGKAYTRKDNLREHLRAHAGEVLRRKKYKCNFCTKHFHGTSLLKIHERTHTGERPFKCDFCSKAFPSTGALTKHRRIHTGEKPYACIDCGVSFSLKGTLNRHMRIHTGVRPHKCEYCGKEFIQAGGLKAHLFFHTGQNGFKCEDCGKLFNRKARLQMHIRYVHEKLKPFECQECGKAFTRREDLYRHSVLHSGEKPHQCPTCQKRFAIKPSLKLHMLTHTKEEPRSCHECGRAFIRKDCLLRHMRKRHRELLNKILLDEKESTTQDPESPGTSHILTEQNICDSIRELLSLLVDESTLKGFGWPDKPVDELLESVIKRCGHTPVNPEDYSYMDRLRENSKLLFTVVIDDNAVKTLLNNQTVDEVILHVLRLAKS